MYCNRCGKEIKPEWKHCRYCGAENGSVKSSGKPKKVTMLLMAIVSFFLIGSGVFFAKDHFKKTLPESSDSLFLLSEGFTDRAVVDSTSARAAIEDVADALHIQNLSADLGKCQENTALGISYYQFQQNYNDIPVYGRSLIVSANGEGKAVQLLGNYTKLDSVDLDPLVSEEQAFDIVRACYGPEIQILSEGLTIYSLLNSSPELTWQFYVGGNEAELCFISAKSGNIVGTDSLLYTETVEGLGLDKDGNEQRFLTEKIDGLYYLKDVQRNIEIFDANGGSITRKYSFVDSEGHTYQEKNNKLFNEKGLETKVVSENGQFVFYDLNDRLLGSGGKATLTLYPPNIFTKLLPVTNKSTEWKQQNAVTLMSRVATAYDFWEQTLGRKSFDGTGGEILVIYRENNEETGAHNAFSTGFTFNLTNLSFGAQNSLSLDTVAHEFTHSVESSISNMKYEKETGAIKEALSDIFGELTESWANGSCDWNHGKRNLKSPKANRYPDYYGGTYWIDPSTNSDDNGGVHTNLTVLSHAAYLMWNGIDGSGLFAKLSTDKLAQLFYLSMYSLPSDCTFSQFSNVVENTARIMCNQSMLTEDEYKTISYAFFQVGIVPAIMPVAKETKVNVYDLHGVAYSDYTLTINGHGQSQSYSAAEIEKNGLRFSDIGDYELVVIDNKNPNNEKRITVTVVERGGKNILPIYTRCGTGDIIALLQHLFGKDSEAVPKGEPASVLITPTLEPVSSSDSTDQTSQPQPEEEKKAPLAIVVKRPEYLLLYKPVIEGILSELDTHESENTYGMLVDLNDDGLSELIILRQHYNYPYYRYSVYSATNGVLKVLAEEESAAYDNIVIRVVQYGGQKALAVFSYGAGSAVMNEQYDVFSRESMTKIISLCADRGYRDGIGSYFYINNKPISEEQYKVETEPLKQSDYSLRSNNSDGDQLKLIDLYYMLYGENTLAFDFSDVKRTGDAGSSENNKTVDYSASADSEELVYDGKYSRREKADRGLIEYHIPRIRMSSTEIKEINNELEAQLSPVIARSEALYESGGNVECSKINYEFAVNGDILSLVISLQRSPDYGGNKYIVYNISISGEKALSSQQLYSSFGLSSDRAQELVRQAAELSWQNTWGNKGNLNKWDEEALRNTLDDNNLSQVQPYLTADGTLHAIVMLYLPVAGGKFYYPVEIINWADN